MIIGLLPITLLLAFICVALATWALIRALTEKRRQGRVLARHAVVLLACGLALWLGISFFFLLRASLGHSAQPLRDARPQCLVSFLVLICAPVTFLVWPARQRKKR
jgi:cytochrome bd-type quinol oxidase subunit 2